MSLSNLNELEDKMKELSNALVKHENYAYAMGYNESLYLGIIKAFVRPQDHHNVIEVIQSRIDNIKNIA